MHVIGTAGHVDHGKSTLIKALTGIDPDRLREEKERQMTIDLGFAWLDLPSGEEIGIVDVPGHRDFIENMLAGAGGIDAVLFIIAADEGVMPQSREHLSILNLLEIKTGIIVLTKVDLVDDHDWLDLVRSEIRQFAENSFLADAPIIGVSSVTGAGLDALLQAIDETIKHCEPKRDIGRARLPVDRIFSIKGFGTVVTGTMLDGIFSVGQQVEIFPSRREVRIRGLQSHKRKLERSEPGSRTAINLSGVDVDDLQRGDVVAFPGIYSSTSLMDVRFSLLPDTSSQLKHNEEVKIFSGAAQSLAHVRLIKKKSLNPGDMGWLQLSLVDALVVAKGDHFILRRPSPAETIGGGIVLDPHPARRYKRFSLSVYDHFEMLETGSLKDQLLDMIRVNQPVTLKEIIEKSGIEKQKVFDELEQLIGEEIVLVNAVNTLLSQNSLLTVASDWQQNIMQLSQILGDYHSRFPLRQGISKNELKESLGWATERLNNYLDGLLIRNLVKLESGMISLPDHRVQFSDEAKQRITEVLKKFQSDPYSPPSLSELMETYSPDLIKVMIANQLLIRTSDDIAFRKENFDEMARKLVEFIHDGGGITLGQFRDIFNTSRKFALSFLEYLDKQGVTRFDGEKRVIRNIDKLPL
jgi:selenocysteine-specific elongation factor